MNGLRIRSNLTIQIDMPTFESEADDMAPVALEKLAERYPKTVALREHRRKHKRTDILLVHLNWNAVEERRQKTSGQPLSTLEQAKYRELRKRTPCPFDDLMPYFLNEYIDSIYESRAYEAYLKLLDKGYLTVSDDVVDIVDYPNVIDSLTAIELKRRRVDKGIKQAEERLNYVNRSYVMVSESHMRTSLKRQDKIESDGLGMMKLSRDELEVLIEPTREEQHNSDYRRLSETAYATVCSQGFESTDMDPIQSTFQPAFKDAIYFS